MRTDDVAATQTKLPPFALHIGRRDWLLGALVVVLSVVAIFGRAASRMPSSS